jgi:hypothetical protein
VNFYDSRIVKGIRMRTTRGAHGPEKRVGVQHLSRVMPSKRAACTWFLRRSIRLLCRFDWVTLQIGADGRR